MKRFLITLSVMFCFLFVSAQIPRDILGCTMGETNIETATKLFKNKGYSVEVVSNGYQIFVKNVTYKGVRWNSVGLVFYKNKLKEIDFKIFSNDYSELQNNYTSFLNEFNKKYISYKERSAFPNCSSYGDQSTTLSIYEPRQVFLSTKYDFTIIISDKYLTRKFLEESYNNF